MSRVQKFVVLQDSKNLLVQIASVPLQVPFSWHVLLADPLNEYPAAHVNTRVVRYATPPGEMLPPGGLYNAGQVTAVRKEHKRKMKEAFA